MATAATTVAAAAAARTMTMIGGCGGGYYGSSILRPSSSSCCRFWWKRQRHAGGAASAAVVVMPRSWSSFSWSSSCCVRFGRFGGVGGGGFVTTTSSNNNLLYTTTRSTACGRISRTNSCVVVPFTTITRVSAPNVGDNKVVTETTTITTVNDNEEEEEDDDDHDDGGEMSEEEHQQYHIYRHRSRSGGGGDGGGGASKRWNQFPDGSRFWKRLPATQDDHPAVARFQRPIFVAATRQHVGKTTVSLALLSGLQKRYGKVGFLKPVGQQHVPVTSHRSGRTLEVDKDVCLMREHFQLHHCDYEHMSPVIIPAGYTKKFVDGEISLSNQAADVIKAMDHVTEVSDVVLCEGTGHCAVGSIVGLNNAKVASIIGADMVLIANGGLGSAFDELELNRVLCQHYNVRVAGVVINKVIPAKYEQTKHYLAKALQQAWGVPLLGCIPDRPFLGCPALADLETLFKTKLMSGAEHRYRHYNIGDINVVTTSLTRFLENLRDLPSRTLYICHVTRDDLIVGFMGEYQRRRDCDGGSSPLEAALIVCGRKNKYQLSQEVTDMLHALQGAPVMVVGMSTHDCMKKIHRFTPKLNIDDTNRVDTAIEHYEPYIDFDELVRRTTSGNSSFNEPGGISLEELRTL